MKRQILIYIVLLELILFLFNACTNPDEPIPAFIKIDTTSLITSNNEGSASHNIKSVWLYANDKPLGIYELPTVVPILEFGEVRILAFAGVNSNGISSVSYLYPFYEFYKINLNIQSNQTYTIKPEFSYNKQSEFKFITDFETSSNFEALPNSAPLIILNNPSDVFEGEHSAHINLDTQTKAFEIVSTNTYLTPSVLKPIFLELNYTNTQNFIVAIKAYNAQNKSGVANLVNVTPKSYWNKIYIELSTALNDFENNGFNQYQIILKSDLPDGETEASFSFDNIKLIQL